MLNTVTGTVLADLLRHGTGAPNVGPLATTLIGSGASMVMTRGKRPMGVLLLAAGGLVLWRETRAAQEAAESRAGIRPAGRAGATGVVA